MTSLVPTGVEMLDRKLDGGLPPGSVICYTVPSTSQAEIVLLELIANRPTIYLTTLRRPASIKADIDAYDADFSACAVYSIDSTAPVETMEKCLNSIPPLTNVVVDPIDTIEKQGREILTRFLRILTRRIQCDNAIAYLVAVDQPAFPVNRDFTMYVSDVVFSFDTVHNVDQIQTTLTIPKCRRHQPIDEAIKLDLRDHIRVDTSRDIS